MPEHPSSHDKLIRQTLQKKELAIAFFEQTLPPEILAIADLSGIEYVESGFIDPQLKDSYSDMLFNVPQRSGGGMQFGILFEHKSAQHRAVFVQFLGYLSSAYRRQLDNGEDLRPIVPFLFYQGRDGAWKLGDTFSGIFNFPAGAEALKPYLPDFKTVVFDLSREDLQRFQQLSELLAVLTAMREIWSENLDFVREVTEWILKIVEPEKRVEVARTLLLYLSYVRREPFETLKTPMETTGALEIREAIMTAAEQLKQEGRLEGEQKGKLEGRLEGKLEDARNFLENGVSLEIILKSTGLTEQQLRDAGII